jgi:hypothetical protein
MKTIFYFSISMMLALAAPAQVSLVWTNGDLPPAQTSDSAFNIKAQNNPWIVNGRYHSLPVNGTNVTTTNGVGGISLWPGKYFMSEAGIPQSWTFTVTNSAQVLNIADITPASSIVHYDGVQGMTGSGGIVVTPPTGAGGVWNVDASGVQGGGTSTNGGDMTGPNSSGTSNLVIFANALGKLTKDSGFPLANIVAQAIFQGFTNSLGGLAFKQTNFVDLAGTAAAVQSAMNSQFAASNTVYQAKFTATTNGPTIYNPNIFGGISTPDGSYLELNPGVNFHTQVFLAWPGVIGGALLYTDTEGGVNTTAIGSGVMTNGTGTQFGATTSLPGSYITTPIPLTSLPPGVITNNWASGFMTNFGIVWYVTNGTPQVALPNGSICLQTSGQIWSRTNNQWVAVNISGTSSGGSGTVTSVALSLPSEFTVSGSPVTVSGTLAASRTAGATANYVGQTATNFSKIVATNQFGVVAAGAGVDATNQFQVDALAGTKAFQISSNGDAFAKNKFNVGNNLNVSGQLNAIGSSNWFSGGLGVAQTGYFGALIYNAAPYGDTNMDGGWAEAYGNVVGSFTVGGPVTNLNETYIKVHLPAAGQTNVLLIDSSGHVTTNDWRVLAKTNQLLSTASLDQVPAPAYFDSGTNIIPVRLYTNALAGTNLTLTFDGFPHRITITNGPNLWITWAGTNGGSWSLDVQTNIQLRSSVTFAKFLSGSNAASAGVYWITNGIFTTSQYGGLGASQLKPAILEY